MQDQTTNSSGGLITVRGEAKLCIPPDTAEISVDVSSNGDTPGAAVERLEKTTGEMRKAVRKAALPVKVLRLASLQVRPNIKRVDQSDGTSQEVSEGYLATQQARINLPLRASTYLKVLENLAKNCPGTRLSLCFTVKKTSTVERNLLRLAAKNASSDAKTLAKTLGLKIVGIESVEKGFVPHFSATPNPQPFLALTTGDPVKPADIEFSLTVLISFLTAPKTFDSDKAQRLSKRKVNSKPVQ